MHLAVKPQGESRKNKKIETFRQITGFRKTWIFFHFFMSLAILFVLDALQWVLKYESTLQKKRGHLTQYVHNAGTPL
jgi:hypothetical protein